MAAEGRLVICKLEKEAQPAQEVWHARRGRAEEGGEARSTRSAGGLVKL